MKIPKITLLMNAERQTERDFLLGITRYAAEFGPWEFFYKPIEYLSDKPENCQMQYKDTDGFIVRGLKNLEKIRHYGKPVIYSGIREESSPATASVFTDSEAIGKLAAEYLLSLGTDSFAFCGFSNVQWSQQRRESFKKNLATRGFNIQEFDISSSILSKTEKDHFHQWLNSLPHPTAIFACNDDCAMQVVEAAKLNNIHIPENISVLGVDNDQLVCSLAHPQLSSIDLNFDRCGYEAAAALDKMLKEGCQSYIQLTVSPVEVVERQSTNIVKLHEKDVSCALEYIRLSYLKPIGVQDVADHSGVSRRVLEKKFQKYLNRSILSEINRLRFDYIARKLLETDLTITEIAAGLSFCSPEHIARQFKNAKGTTPGEYRRKYARNLPE